MLPEIKDIVLFTVDAYTANRVNNEREHDNKSGHLRRLREGLNISVGDVYPLIVTSVYPSGMLDGQMILDTDTYWVRDAKEGTEPGTWRARE